LLEVQGQAKAIAPVVARTGTDQDASPAMFHQEQHFVGQRPTGPRHQVGAWGAVADRRGIQVPHRSGTQK
jgi:hypothetical protein